MLSLTDNNQAIVLTLMQDIHVCMKYLILIILILINLSLLSDV